MAVNADEFHIRVMSSTEFWFYRRIPRRQRKETCNQQRPFEENEKQNGSCSLEIIRELNFSVVSRGFYVAVNATQFLLRI